MTTRLAKVKDAYLTSPGARPFGVCFMRDGLEHQLPQFRTRISGDALVLTLEVVDVVEEALREVEATGVVPALSLRDEPWGQRHFMLRDPAGVWVDVGKLIDADPEFVGKTSGSRRCVTRFAGNSERLAELARRAGACGDARGTGAAIALARLVPGAPFDLVSYASGLSTVRVRPFVWGTALGSAPHALAYAALGASLHMPLWVGLAATAGLGAIFVTVATCLRNRPSLRVPAPHGHELSLPEVPDRRAHGKGNAAMRLSCRGRPAGRRRRVRRGPMRHGRRWSLPVPPAYASVNRHPSRPVWPGG